MVNSLVTFLLVMRPYRILPHPLSGAWFSQSVYRRTYLQGSVRRALQRVLMQARPIFIQFTQLTQNLYMPHFAHGIELINYHKQSFHQIVLCLRMSKIKDSGSDSQSLKQHWLLRHVEPNRVLASRSLVTLLAVKVTETHSHTTHVYTK